MKAVENGFSVAFFRLEELLNEVRRAADVAPRLAIGNLTTTPWTNVPMRTRGPSFAIPPGLPPGTSVALQVFELMSSGTDSLQYVSRRQSPSWRS